MAYESLSNNILFLLASIGADFTSADLSNMKITDLDLSNLDMRGATFKNSRLFDVRLANTDLKETNFENCIMEFSGGWYPLSDINGGLGIDFCQKTNTLIYIGRFCLHVYDVETKEMQQIPLENKKISISNMNVVYNDAWIIWLSKSYLEVFDLNSNKLIYSKKITFSWMLNALSKSKDRKKFAVCTDEIQAKGKVLIWDTERLNDPIELKFDNSGIFATCFSNNGDLLLAGGRNGIIFWFEIKTSKMFRKTSKIELDRKANKVGESNSNYIYTMCFNSNDSLIAVGSTSPAIFLISSDTGELIKTISLPEGYTTLLEFSPDDNFLACVIFNKILVLQTSDYSTYFEADGYDKFTFSSDSKFIALGSSHSKTEVKVIKLEDVSLATQHFLNLDFAGCNIGGLKAPAAILESLISRGATGWFTEDELLHMSKEEFEAVIKYGKLDHEPFNQLSRPDQIRQILTMININS